MLALERNYRTILQEELERRRLRNPSYSLRAFARDLEISPSRLSDVMKGRYGLSRESGLEIARRLGLSQPETEYFAQLIAAEHSRARKDREQARTLIESRAVKYPELNIDQFRIVSDWYHYAILELVGTAEFSSDARSVVRIAEALGLRETVAAEAIERLKRLELLEEREGRLAATDARTASPDGIPSEAIRKFHTQVSEKAQHALHSRPVDGRDFSSMVLAFDASEMDEAKKMIREFRRAFDERFGKSASPRLTDETQRNRKAHPRAQVHALAIQFFSLEASPENGKKPTPEKRKERNRK